MLIVLKNVKIIRRCLNFIRAKTIFIARFTLRWCNKNFTLKILKEKRKSSSYSDMECNVKNWIKFVVGSKLRECRKKVRLKDKMVV